MQRPSVIGVTLVFLGAMALAFLPQSPAPVPASAREPAKSPFQLPPGFVIEKVAGPPLVEHPMMACFDERGRLFVAEAAGKNLKAADLLKELPNSIRVLEPADDKGHFKNGGVFADKMSLPMGVLWHDNALYTASPPSFWKLLDTKNAGVADKRIELVTKFNFTGNAADVHGPFLGPDGRLYWCDGRHGHEIKRPDGSTMKGKAARIFRCKPDGTDVEVVCGGGMDNPVEVAFTEEGEPFATVNILHNRPARNDGIIYCIEGGVYPWHDVYKEFPRTGDLLPAAADLGWVAPSGLMCYRSDAFGKGYRNNLFSAQFNRSRIQRHIVERSGAGFRMKTEDFLVSSDKNFHPTDVLEDADGSLLVVDTGGWFRIGCPTSQIAKPEIKGGIYRIRKKDAAARPDSRGLKLDWNELTPLELAGHLDDPRPAVRDRAIYLLAEHGGDSVRTLSKFVATASPELRRNAVWALTRMDTPKVRQLARSMLDDDDRSVRLAATHSVGLYRDDKSLRKLMDLVVKDDQPAVRRNAASALGRLGKAEAVSSLMEALGQENDRFLEHALIYAAIQIADRTETAKYLKKQGPARRAALIALDQMPNGNLTREEVTPLLTSDDSALLQTALGIIANRPGWGPEIVDLLEDWLRLPELDAARQESVRGLIVGLAKDSAIQDVTARVLRRPLTAAPIRVLLLDAMARASLAKLPASWTQELGKSLKRSEPAVVQQAVATTRALNLPDFDKTLLGLVGDKKLSVELRLSAFSAAAPRVKKVEAAHFQFLVHELGKDRPPLVRLSAAGGLAQARLEPAQLLVLNKAVAEASALELPHLLAAFEKGSDAAVGMGLAATLEKAPAFAGLAPSVVERTFKSYPPEVTKAAAGLIKRLEADLLKQRERLVQMEPMLQDGDAGQGKLVFFGTKSSCSVCHTVAGAGGKIGPDLTKIGAIRSGRDLLEAVIFPSASFARGYEPYVVEMRSGRTVTGIIGRETTDALYLVTTERAEIRIPRVEIEAFVPGRVSIMPQGLETQISTKELRDLMAYLQGLR